MQVIDAIEPPAELDPAPAGLGSFAPWLHALARAQGSWPPAVPRSAAAGPVSSWDGGATAADALVDGGADLVVVASDAPPGPALVVLGILLRLDPAGTVGTSGGAGWAALVAEVRSGMAAVKDLAVAPLALAERAGADTVAGAAGLVVRCAARRTPVLVGPDPVAVAAAVLAARVAPDVRPWLLGATSASGGGASAGLAELDVPLLLDARTPAALPLALGLIDHAVALARG
jgi:NaMN:DMB phosphoribosyltransferase